MGIVSGNKSELVAVRGGEEGLQLARLHTLA